MKAKLTIVKVGGKIVEDSSSLARLITDFANMPGFKMLVHGGGRTATDVAAKMGIDTRMVAGRRVTDEAMLRVVTMVYGGLVNKNVVAQLQSSGVSALGLTGADMDVIRSHRRPAQDVDYGFVGDVDNVRADRLAQLLHSGITPVMAPLTHDGQGLLLNTNADTIAARVAIALSDFFSVTLTYCFEFPGVLSDPQDVGSVIPYINQAKFEDLVTSGQVTGGMIPKLENCLACVQSGVENVVITRADCLGNGGGTVIGR